MRYIRDLFKVPHRVKNKMPVWAINLMWPSHSPLKKLPYQVLGPTETASFQSVLVVSPHPDDETLACGGLIALLAQARSKVQFVVVCDGSGSHPHSREYPPAKLIGIRRIELGSALRTLGIVDSASHYLGVPDNAAPFPEDEGFSDVVERMSGLLASEPPDVVIIPWRRDSSRDHRAVWHIVTEAISRASIRPRVLEYPVWVWAEANDAPYPGEVRTLKLDISLALDKKRKAIACHRSQLGGLIKDDPSGFKLERIFLANFDVPWELYFEVA